MIQATVIFYLESCFPKGIFTSCDSADLVIFQADWQADHTFNRFKGCVYWTITNGSISFFTFWSHETNVSIGIAFFTQFVILSHEFECFFVMKIIYYEGYDIIIVYLFFAVRQFFEFTEEVVDFLFCERLEAKFCQMIGKGMTARVFT